MKPQTAAGSTQPKPNSARGSRARKGRDAPKSAAVVRRLVRSAPRAAIRNTQSERMCLSKKDRKISTRVGG